MPVDWALYYLFLFVYTMLLLHAFCVVLRDFMYWVVLLDFVPMEFLIILVSALVMSSKDIMYVFCSGLFQGK